MKMKQANITNLLEKMNLNKRISTLEQDLKPDEPELYFNAMTADQFDRLVELAKKMDAGEETTEAENREAHELAEIAEIDSKKEFLKQYDKQPPQKLRTIFDDFAEYQKSNGFVDDKGRPNIPAYYCFADFLDEQNIKYIS